MGWKQEERRKGSKNGPGMKRDGGKKGCKKEARMGQEVWDGAGRMQEWTKNEAESKKGCKKGCRKGTGMGQDGAG